MNRFFKDFSEKENYCKNKNIWNEIYKKDKISYWETKTYEILSLPFRILKFDSINNNFFSLLP